MGKGQKRREDDIIWLVGGGGGGCPVSWHIHTQGAVHFSLHNEHTSCVMARIVLTGTVNC